MKSAPSVRSKGRPAMKKAQRSDAGTKLAGNSRLSGEQKLVLRDIWIYAAGLFTVTALVGLLISNFVLLILAPAAAVCIIGGLLLHLATIERFSRARRNGTSPSRSRIFG